MESSYVWSVTETVALSSIHKAIIGLLRDQPKMYLPIKDLIYQMNRVTRETRFHAQNKHNRAIKYINDRFGSFENFLDDYGFYAILERNRTYVYFLEHNYSEDLCKPRITKDREWVFVAPDDY